MTTVKSTAEMELAMAMLASNVGVTLEMTVNAGLSEWKTPKGVLSPSPFFLPESGRVKPGGIQWTYRN